MTRSVFCFALVASLQAASIDSPTGPRNTPPTLNVINPIGIPRGTTTEITIEGLNLAKASAVYFSEPGVKGRVLHVKELPDLPDIRLGANGTVSTIDLGPLPPRNQVSVEVEVSSDAEIGPVALRVLTPLGTSPEGRILIEPFYGEMPSKEPDDTIENAVETYLPAILTGTISKPGDIDLFKIQVKPGEELTFYNTAMLAGSTLQPVVSILDADQKILHEYGEDGGMDGTMFAYRFDKGGTYYVRVADYLESGKTSNFYRIIVGKFPLVARAYPLGAQRAKARDFTLAGWNVPATAKVAAASTGEDDNLMLLRPAHAFNRIRLAVGDEPEIESARTNMSVATAQAVSAPITINGVIANGDKPQFFRFYARKGEKLVIDVNAQRLGSKLDSVVDILNASGAPVERATIRSVLETSNTLADRDSASRGLRLLSWTGMNVGDYLMAGGEIIRISKLPEGPDEDVLFESFNGQRLAYFDTTNEAQAIDKPIYKVQIHPPGSHFAPNGLPVVHLNYRNDDGGPGYGKDSLVHFTSPADGDYIVRLADVRGAGGDDYAYRLTIRPPRPDFRLSVTPRNPNVPAGGAIPITVTALRLDEFDAPIDVKIVDLPAGLHATKGVIAAGQVSTTLLLSADAGAKLEQAATLSVKGTARAGGATIARFANPDDHLKLIALMPQADIATVAETKVVEVEAGKKAQVAVRIQRHNGFGGRVPIEVRNLPPRVRVTDVGLNGVLINEDEDHRTFTIEALPQAEPIEQLIYLSGLIETRSPQQNSYAAPTPIVLRVKPSASQVAKAPQSTGAR
jgi:hypothetical protein